MGSSVKIGIITIGNELLSGFTIDRNSAWIGQRLLEIGLKVHVKKTIADDADMITKSLDEFSQDCDHIIITGGLGPTLDDITVKTLYEYFGDSPVFDEEYWKELEKQDLDGIILAAAGIKSLNLENKVGFFFETEEILPAAGQGIIAVQCKENNKVIKNFIKKINHTNTSLCAIAERKMLQTIGGDCDTAIGGFAEIKDNNLKLKSQLFSDSGDESFEYELVGRDVDAAYIGKSVGEKLLSLAGKKFKKK